MSQETTEQIVREIITKYAGASSVETSPDRFSFITDQATSKIMKLIKEKDERIKEFEKERDAFKFGLTLNAQLLSRQKAVDGLVEALRNIALSCKLSWFTKEGARTIAKKALSHYQSLNGGKHEQ